MDPSTFRTKIPQGPLDLLAFRVRRRKEEEALVVSGAAFAAALMLENEESEENQKKAKKLRSVRRYFDCQAAFDCIMRDHLRQDRPLFGAEFVMFFRLSRTHVQLLLEDFGRYSQTNPFFESLQRDKVGRVGSSLEVKVLLPLRILAYGTAPHAFCDYFQVSRPIMAREIYKQFIFAISHLYKDTYLGLPTPRDLKKVTELHKAVHGVPSMMMGSLDCMLTKWKNCPVGWQQSFKGRYKSFCSIVLEAACNYNLWFWHAAYGFSGSLNDGNVLSLSPLLDQMTNGSFKSLEEESGVVPYTIDGTIQPFDKTYFLVDNIYPRYSCFVKGIQQPILRQDRRFTRWQESARKDIERAFGVLQCRWKAVALPIYFLDQECIFQLVTTCLILHNMCVQERIMESCSERYDPSVRVDPKTAEDIEDDEEEDMVEQPLPLVLGTGLEHALQLEIVCQREWLCLDNLDEWRRLQNALVECIARQAEE